MGIVALVGGRAISSLVVLALLCGCSANFPTDPDGTLERVRDGVLRVGVSPNPPWTDQSVDLDPPALTGIEVSLVEAFADSLDAELEWTTGGEETLIMELERDELDLVIGGLTAESPWSSHAALTYPFAETLGPDGAKEMHVMAASMGENAFLVELERFLLAQDVRP